MNDDTISIRRFVWLLDQRGYAYVPEDQLERVIAVRNTRPDFWIDTRKGLQFLAEVKAFKTARASSNRL